MTSKVAGAAKGGIRAWLMPEINDIKVQLAEMRGDIRSLNTRIEEMDKRFSEKIDEVDKRLGENDKRLSEKIDEVDKRLNENDKRLSEKIDDLDKRLDIVQRLAIVEAKLREQEKKSSA